MTLCRGRGAIEIGDNVFEGAQRINSKMTGKAVRPQLSLSVRKTQLKYTKYNEEILTYKSVENTHKQMYSTCTPHVYHMYTTSKSHVHHIYTKCTQYVLNMYIKCTPHVHDMYIHHSIPHVHQMYTIYTL